MEESPHVKLSVSLALEALQEASDRVLALELDLEEARAVRNDLIAGAIDDVSLAKLSRITKLSRQSLYKIAPRQARQE